MWIWIIFGIGELMWTEELFLVWSLFSKKHWYRARANNHSTVIYFSSFVSSLKSSGHLNGELANMKWTLCSLFPFSFFPSFLPCPSFLVSLSLRDRESKVVSLSKWGRIWEKFGWRGKKNMVKINQAEERKEEGTVGARGVKDTWRAWPTGSPRQGICSSQW